MSLTSPLISSFNSSFGLSLSKEDPSRGTQSQSLKNLVKWLGEETLTPRFRSELSDIAREPDKQIAGHSLFVFACRLSEDGAAPSLALEIHRRLSETEGLSPELRSRSLRLIKAAQGQGHLGDRFQFLAPQLFDAVLNPESLLFMTGLGMIGKFSQAAMLTSFTRGGAFIETFGWQGTKMFSGLASIGVEAGSMTLLSKGLHFSAESLGASLQHSWGEELASNLLFLGALRGSQVLGKALGMGNGLSFGGIALAQKIQEASGLRHFESSDQFWLQAVAGAASAFFGGRLEQAIFGKSFATWNARLDIAGRQRATVAPAFGPALASTGGVFVHPEAQRLLESSAWMMVAHNPVSGQGDNAALIKIPPQVFSAGRLGDFVKESVGAMSIFTPKLPEPASFPPKGRVILTSGAGGNFTSFGELPQILARQGWDVKLAVYPGYENPSDPTPFRGKGLKAWHLRDQWVNGVKEGLTQLVKTAPDGPVHLVGFSMGGAGTLLAYESMPANVRAMVSGLILGAPATHFTLLEGPSVVKNWVTNHLVLPLNAFTGREFVKTNRGFECDIAEDIAVAMTTPRTTSLAAVRLGEQARTATARLKDQPVAPIMLIHSGKGDPTVSYKSADFMRGVFGGRIEREILLPKEAAHWVFAGQHRHKVHEAIGDFLERK